MELKWLEDLLSVAEIGNFSRAAEARLVTQSALSRRIQSLELWVGVELLDRSQHPISLTPEGEDFIAVAREIVAQSYDAKRKAMANSRIAATGVRVACLHTLALYFLPGLFADLRRKIGAFQVSIVAETRTIDEYLTALLNGGSDFFISYDHPSVRFDIDPDAFPSKEIGIDRMIPFQADGSVMKTIADASDDPIPYLEFSKTSYMSHVVGSILQAAPAKLNLAPVFRASLAESLFTAARGGLGLAWLPESIVNGGFAEKPVAATSDPWSTTMKIKIYRAAQNSTHTVEAIWQALESRE
ncbi:MAG: LysR family transcriptional regulator [Sphingopyxis sp.]|uniref:LysR family transcriptional regulator n=1 Tax=Sphingopyxis sp. TaxID=1908224 RepID=UPI002ABB8323|nr:LysR family transcriptional regulator [Sphingopyxis sp.]MDZ3833295.1 LysR family transcriptional regulator [Sphingopyxis sp.]